MSSLVKPKLESIASRGDTEPGKRMVNVEIQHLSSESLFTLSTLESILLTSSVESRAQLRKPAKLREVFWRSELRRSKLGSWLYVTGRKCSCYSRPLQKPVGRFSLPPQSSPKLICFLGVLGVVGSNRGMCFTVLFLVLLASI